MTEARDNLKRIMYDVCKHYGYTPEPMNNPRLDMAVLKAYISTLEYKTVEAFLRQLWGACLNYYREDIDSFEFIDSMTVSIAEQLTRAWNEGMREVGAEPGDMTDADQDVLDGIIQNEYDYILGLADSVDQARADGLDRVEFSTRFKPRVDMWANRYPDVVNQAKLYYGKKEKLIWVLGATEEHCTSCAALNGIVAYAEEWDQSGVRPQNPPKSAIECGGWKCDCSLEVTDRRRSAGALTSIMDIATSGNV